MPGTDQMAEGMPVVVGLVFVRVSDRTCDEASPERA